MDNSIYRGRFAPSPTGPLHFGSLVAALGSYLEARAHKGQWLLRIEDVDTPRSVDGAADSILRDLEAFGFEWDGAVVFQSQGTSAYRDAFEQLQHAGPVFPCACSRREIADSVLNAAPALNRPSRYPGTCRNGLSAGRAARAWRVRVAPGEIYFEDVLQGKVCQELEQEIGDYVLLRAGGLFAYQLAVVVDDAAQGVTNIVRGADLLDSTPRQIYLQRLLGLPTPAYLHLPIVLNAKGEKLSKQTLAQSLSNLSPPVVLTAALAFLSQMPPADLAEASLAEVWYWALANWESEKLPSCRSLPAPAGFL